LDQFYIYLRKYNIHKRNFNDDKIGNKIKKKNVYTETLFRIDEHKFCWQHEVGMYFLFILDFIAFFMFGVTLFLLLHTAIEQLQNAEKFHKLQYHMI
jgi:hypothetical protein